MTIQGLINQELFEVVSLGNGLDIELTEVFCCDLLSVAMGKAPVAGVWVTVMGNMNTLAVASLTEIGCIVLAEGMELDAMTKEKAIQEEITVLKTSDSVFRAALKVHRVMK